jgi:hypothetical protein
MRWAREALTSAVRSGKVGWPGARAGRVRLWGEDSRDPGSSRRPGRSGWRATGHRSPTPASPARPLRGARSVPPVAWAPVVAPGEVRDSGTDAGAWRRGPIRARPRPGRCPRTRSGDRTKWQVVRREGRRALPAPPIDGTPRSASCADAPHAGCSGTGVLIRLASGGSAPRRRGGISNPPPRPRIHAWGRARGRLGRRGSARRRGISPFHRGPYRPSLHSTHDRG